MYFYRMRSTDIRVNLATEQYLMNQKAFDEPLALFYIQEPCIIIGKNQNIYEEINLRFVEEQNIVMTRRLSGGGAVYDDLGNVSFSFVVDQQAKAFGDFESFTEPIVQALHRMGATAAEMNGRNDLLIEGKKFSGNAMYHKNGKTFSHGTLMYDVDLAVLPQALTVSQEKLASKGVKSVRSRVTNLKPYLAEHNQFDSTQAFRDALICELYQVTDLAAVAEKEVQLTAEDEQAIAQLVRELYANDAWVFEKSPGFTLERKARFTGVGLIDAKLTIEAGKIQHIRFFGDYFGKREIQELENRLEGVVYREQVLREALSEENIADYFLNLTSEQLIQLLVQE